MGGLGYVLDGGGVEGGEVGAGGVAEAGVGDAGQGGVAEAGAEGLGWGVVVGAVEGGPGGLEAAAVGVGARQGCLVEAVSAGEVGPGAADGLSAEGMGRRRWWATSSRAVVSARLAYQAPRAASVKRAPSGEAWRKAAMTTLALGRPMTHWSRGRRWRRWATRRSLV